MGCERIYVFVDTEDIRTFAHMCRGYYSPANPEVSHEGARNR